MTIPYGFPHGEMLDDSHVTRHQLQPVFSGDLSDRLPDDFDFDPIFTGLNSAGMESLDLTAAVSTFAFSETPADSQPSDPASFQLYTSTSCNTKAASRTANTHFHDFTFKPAYTSTVNQAGSSGIPVTDLVEDIIVTQYTGGSNLPIFSPTLTMHDPTIWPNDQLPARDTLDNVNFRIETKQVFVCTYGTCKSRYARLADLRRHHRGAHQGNDQFKCRASNCHRAIRGFSRRDKRDSHEKSMHGRRG